MPIYEFYCEACNTIFNFLSRRINTGKVPACPKCGTALQRQMSTFAVVGRAKEENNELPPGFDEARMEQAMGELMREAEHINEDDPRQMAQFMRKFTEKSGLNLGDGMEEAIARLEAGEDPEKIEREMGDVFEGEDPVGMLQKKNSLRRRQPFRDETLYEL
jgi:putative FmdB family regulatory protein